MKYILLLLAMLFASFAVETLAQKLVTKDGLVYQETSEEPYSGERLIHYKNGQLHWKISYKDGKKEGLSEVFDNSGKLKSQRTYKNGELED